MCGVFVFGSGGGHKVKSTAWVYLGIMLLLKEATTVPKQCSFSLKQVRLFVKCTVCIAVIEIGMNAGYTVSI